MRKSNIKKIILLSTVLILILSSVTYVFGGALCTYYSDQIHRYREVARYNDTCSYVENGTVWENGNLFACKWYVQCEYTIVDESCECGNFSSNMENFHEVGRTYVITNYDNPLD